MALACSAPKRRHHKSIQKTRLGWGHWWDPTLGPLSPFLTAHSRTLAKINSFFFFISHQWLLYFLKRTTICTISFMVPSSGASFYSFVREWTSEPLQKLQSALLQLIYFQNKKMNHLISPLMNFS